jgi:hypothetical protein
VGGLVGGMARPKSLRCASGGGAALKPAFAGYGRYENPAAIELPRPFVNMIPVLGSSCRVPEVVHSDDSFRTQAKDSMLRPPKNFALERVIRKELLRPAKESPNVPIPPFHDQNCRQN